MDVWVYTNVTYKYHILTHGHTFKVEFGEHETWNLHSLWTLQRIVELSQNDIWGLTSGTRFRSRRNICKTGKENSFMKENWDSHSNYNEDNGLLGYDIM